AVPQILGDVPAVFGDDRAAAGMQAVDELVPIFRIEHARQLRRADQVAEQNPDLAAPRAGQSRGAVVPGRFEAATPGRGESGQDRVTGATLNTDRGNAGVAMLASERPGLVELVARETANHTRRASYACVYGTRNPARCGFVSPPAGFCSRVMRRRRR